MRLAPLSLVISLSLFTWQAHGQDTNTVSSIQAEIDIKQSEFKELSSVLDKHLQQEKQFQDQLELLRSRAVSLEKERNQSLDAMNDLYRRLIEDPTLDITNAQKRYQKSIADLQQNKQDIDMQLAAIASHRKDIESIRVSKHTLVNTLESLKEQKNTARVERLRNEFTREGTVEVNHTVNCKRTETLAACEQRGQAQGLQKATKRFMDQIFANITEQRTVEPKRNMSGAQVQVLSSHVVSSSFSGQGNYNTNLSVSMRGEVNSSRLCNLLNLDNRFCSDYGTSIPNVYQPVVNATYSEPVVRFKDDRSVPASSNMVTNKNIAEVNTPKKERLFELTLRSNVRGDEVFINGVSYGSTRLDVSLPAGSYDIEIRKQGYQVYTRSVDLKRSQTIRANLRKEVRRAEVSLPDVTAPTITTTPNYSEPELQTQPQRFNETTVSSSKGMVVIPAGEFEMGDLTGNGLANEQPVVKKILSDSYAIHDKEVTVAEYNEFVAATGYQTEAESGEGCAYYLNGEPVWEATLNWRSPGYDQADNFPVVCLTYNDSKAYADWLSEKTGNEYRLPTEVEWEFAARAGTKTDYPWGNDIGNNQANCGWCGSEWSNQSPAPVGSFSANRFGVYDTVGNVWEWTQKTAGRSDVAIRGGAWNFAPTLARASTRLILATDFRANYIGFRLVRER